MTHQTVWQSQIYPTEEQEGMLPLTRKNIKNRYQGAQSLHSQKPAIFLRHQTKSAVSKTGQGLLGTAMNMEQVTAVEHGQLLRFEKNLPKAHAH